ncbi:lipid-A-disaccharide synthase [Mongoliimonas terrestris]|uniref:lipid-A-disaccharide synthase n=1 Tax=Mongoliimonas terrestris TaxID=1709001 RepID=UPI0009499934|nr:lipid-A-disaccharide synthase [Mongoliimonas terrestris]
MSPDARPLKVFLVVGEESGDQLGARLMEALIRRTGGAVHFSGVGGSRMQALGLSTLFPLHDIAVMGIGPVLARLPTIVRRVYATVAAVVAEDPDVLVIIDSPDFTHQVAKRVRKARPQIPVVGYVSPSVWAWRPGRARKMAAYVDHLLAILPFEPAIHARLAGPPTTYVGHPLIDRPNLLLGTEGERLPIAAADPPTLLVLPGSRQSEVSRLLAVFGETVKRLAASGASFDLVIPAVPHLVETIKAGTAGWVIAPRIVTGEAAKFAAFRRAHAALAASGTVTLELALAGVPMVVAYRLDALFRVVKRVVLAMPGQVQVSSMVLPNIILGRNVVPERLDAAVTPDTLAADLGPLLADTPVRRAQVDAFADLWTLMALPGGRSPGDAAAEVVLATARRTPPAA